MARTVNAIVISVLLCLAVLLLDNNFARGNPDDERPIPCEMYSQSSAIFAGRILSFKIVKGENNDDMVFADFKVTEAFTGAEQDSNVTVRISADSADELDFANGKSFLVYARKDENSNGLNMWDFSRPLNKARSDLDFLRTLSLLPSVPSVFGDIQLTEKSSLERDSQRPLAETTVNVQPVNGRMILTTTTDINGHYNVEGLIPGPYRIWVDGLKGTDYSSDEPSIEVREKGCTQINVAVRPVSNVSGNIVGPDGNPMGGVPLELIPIDYVKSRWDDLWLAETTESAENGAFTFGHVPPGKYNIAVNYERLPTKEKPFQANFLPAGANRAKAQVIEVRPRQNTEGLKLQFKPEVLKERPITGRIVYQDGHPAVGIEVYIKDEESRGCCPSNDITTNAKGEFSIMGFGGRKYRIMTEVYHKPFTNKINYLGISSVFVLNGPINLPLIVLMPTLKDPDDVFDEIEKRERGKK